MKDPDYRRMLSSGRLEAIHCHMAVRLDVWSDYVCPFCYLEEPVVARTEER
jgi:hypothetical protein